MARFKIGDKVIPSKSLEKYEALEWFKRVKDKVEDDGYLVISLITETGTYAVEGLPDLLFIGKWLEPYVDSIPSPSHLGLPGCMSLVPLPEYGLSMRDQFAMAALKCFNTDVFEDPYDYLAEKAYKVADAMMKVRNERKTEEN